MSIIEFVQVNSLGVFPGTQAKAEYGLICRNR